MRPPFSAPRRQWGTIGSDRSKGPAASAPRGSRCVRVRGVAPEVRLREIQQRSGFVDIVVLDDRVGSLYPAEDEVEQYALVVAFRVGRGEAKVYVEGIVADEKGRGQDRLLQTSSDVTQRLLYCQSVSKPRTTEPRLTDASSSYRTATLTSGKTQRRTMSYSPDMQGLQVESRQVSKETEVDRDLHDERRTMWKSSLRRPRILAHWNIVQLVCGSPQSCTTNARAMR